MEKLWKRNNLTWGIIVLNVPLPRSWAFPMSTESMTTTGAAVPQAAADGVTNPKGIGLFRMVTTVITLIVGAGRVLAVG